SLAQLLAECSEYFFGMIFRLYFLEDLFDFTLLINQESHAVIANVCAAHELLLAVSAETLLKLLIGIGQQTKRQAELVNKFLMRLFAVERNAEDFNPTALELCPRITKRTCFFGATRRVVFRIEIQSVFLAAQIFRAHDVAFLIRHRKVGCLVAFF